MIRKGEPTLFVQLQLSELWLNTPRLIVSDAEILPTLLLLAPRGKCVLALLFKEQVKLSTLSSQGIVLSAMIKDIWLPGVL